jgi:hypothetical protein
VTEELAFFVYLIEQYGAARGTTGGAVLRRLDELSLTDVVMDLGWQYHQEPLENAFTDLDHLLAGERLAAEPGHG